MKKEIKVYRDLMGANEEWAQKTRVLLQEKKTIMINLIGSPGAGKTALLEKSHTLLAPPLRLAVLEGDVETTKDAERLLPLNIPVSQLLTGGACHLEAKLVHYALLDLPLDNLDLVIVENVGNLVCPAEFDIGEKAKIAVLSVTEGEDKALKYPLLFREAQAVVITKKDLLPYLPFRLDACLEAVKQINSQAPVFVLSSLTGEGLDAWAGWLKEFGH
ncbi:hydrogenase nickel incorporation protein HypB [candidate division FCPU426 bacterium]|nr:hydrogenase nickel incorporation protein HypB [candidate division FCPU426 bacterium]